LVVTDSGVPTEYAAQIAAVAGQPVLLTVAQGEGSKSLSTLELLWRTMLEHSFTRGDCVVAVGGGVVGDLCGFAAATYMRGIDFYTVPTTPLSQVDSSIGGKTAIDFEGMKNIVGSFYQPKGVLIDPDTLQTLDARQKRAGTAEIIKMALTLDAELFEQLVALQDVDEICDDILCRALSLKRDVVEQDPTERGLRRVLNFGHTVGHAIEAVAQGELLHGECVGLGMLPLCAPPLRATLRALLERIGLPTTHPYSAQTLLPYLCHDKKAIGNEVLAVYADAPGEYRIVQATPEWLLAQMEDAR
jgi:3-dehydroquinate synthase